MPHLILHSATHTLTPYIPYLTLTPTQSTLTLHPPSSPQTCGIILTWTSVQVLFYIFCFVWSWTIWFIKSKGRKDTKFISKQYSPICRVCLITIHSNFEDISFLIITCHIIMYYHTLYLDPIINFLNYVLLLILTKTQKLGRIDCG